MAEETGIRSYGPGKFDTILDSYAYGVTLEGADEEAALGEGNGWYRLLQPDKTTRDRIHQAAHYEEDDLTEEESDLLEDSVAVIFFERSDGIVESDWFDDMGKAKKAWDQIEADIEEDLDDDEDEDEDFDLESEMEDALVIGDARGNRYSVSFSGKHVGDFSDFDDTLAAGVREMHDSNYFPNIFYVNDHGNTDLMTVKYELQNGKPVNIKSTTVRGWV